MKYKLYCNFHVEKKINMTGKQDSNKFKLIIVCIELSINDSSK